MAAFEIQYFGMKYDHITLKADGTIEIFLHKEEHRIDYEQSATLKRMIIAQYELEKREK